MRIDDIREEQAERLEVESQIRKLCAKDAMIKPVLLFPDDDVNKILRKLKKEHINACIVVSKEKKFIGKISDNDIIQLFLQQVKYEPLVKILNRGYRREFLYKSAKDMVNDHKACVHTSTPINEVIKSMFKEGFEYLPVLDTNDGVVGVVTPSSLIQVLKDY